MSIMPQEPQSKTHSPTSLRSVADRMSDSPDEFAANVGLMVECIAIEHEPPVTCRECRDADRDQSFPCLSYENALSAAFAWLLKVVDERG